MAQPTPVISATWKLFGFLLEDWYWDVGKLAETNSRDTRKIGSRPKHATNSCPPRKLPALRGHFHLFPLFDEEGNADFQARLQPGSLVPPPDESPRTAGSV